MLHFKSTSFVLLSALLVASRPVLDRRVDASTVASLAPSLGFQSGVNPTGTGDCDGAVNGADGKPIKVPCSCPPPQDEYISQLQANVAAGHAVNNPSVSVDFPTDNSAASQHARITAAIVTLQNLNGPGVGCPSASTTLTAQSNAIDAGQSPAPAPAPAPSPSPAASSPPPSQSSQAAPQLQNAAAINGDTSIAALAPPLGLQSGLNPTGTGDCDGAVKGADGNPVKVPCTCPPPQDEYISQLEANVAAGHAVNNPGVLVTFPTDNSPASQRARITAATITIQNLKGPGVGCPQASTTFGAQSAAIQG